MGAESFAKTKKSGLLLYYHKSMEKWKNKSKCVRKICSLIGFYLVFGDLWNQKCCAFMKKRRHKKDAGGSEKS